MTRREQRKDVFEAITAAVGRMAQSVVRPDHPLLLHPPDALVAVRSGLIAAFVPTVAEIRQPERLEARIALSRLALPQNLLVVLVPVADDLERSDLLRWVADAVFDHRELEAGLRQLDNAIPRRGGEVVALARTAALRRMAAALEGWLPVEDDDDEDDEILGGPSDPFDVPDTGTQSEGFYWQAISDQPLSPGQLRSALKELALESLETDFLIHEGLPVRRSVVLPVHEVAARVPDLDLAKPRHYQMATAAAFAGWSLRPYDGDR